MLEAEGPLRLLVADSTGLYWVELVTKDNKTRSRVMYLPAGENRILELAQDSGIIRSLVIDSQNLYWLSDLVLMRYSKEKSKMGVMAELDGQGYSLVADDQTLYWVSGKGDKIYFLRKLGGDPQVLTVSTAISSISTDENFIYWVSSGDQNKGFSDGSINRIQKNNGKPTRVISEIGNPSSIQLDQENIYWSADSEIWYSSKKTMSQKVTAVGNGNLNRFIMDSDFLYGANVSDSILWKLSKKNGKIDVISDISDVYDFAIYNGRIFWTQNARGSGGPLTAKGRINSFCQPN